MRSLNLVRVGVVCLMVGLVLLAAGSALVDRTAAPELLQPLLTACTYALVTSGVGLLAMGAAFPDIPDSEPGHDPAAAHPTTPFAHR
ncbi:hypothetical protein ACQE98_00235 [Ornithinimicrobium sp. W1679]|uniref:hypothetical protein n=1 Tax=Ornithinimicrobium sp. W1679 TaxID=3418770 RepID=UPI003CF22BA9